LVSPHVTGSKLRQGVQSRLPRSCASARSLKSRCHASFAAQMLATTIGDARLPDGCRGEAKRKKPAAKRGREIPHYAGRPFSDRIGIFDRRSERGRESRPAPFGPVKPSGMQRTQMTAGLRSESGGFLEFDFGGVAEGVEDTGGQ
jgi:hypothetical protein